MAPKKIERINALDDLKDAPVTRDYEAGRQEIFDQIKSILKSQKAIDRFLDTYIEGKNVGKLKGISALYNGKGKGASRNKYFALELARMAIMTSPSRAEAQATLRETLRTLNQGRNPETWYNQICKTVYNGLATRRSQRDLGEHILERERRSTISPDLRESMRHGSPEHGQDQYAAAGHNGNEHRGRAYRR